ncbi:uncharacterized protein ColKHC_06906 [Colletotrichum higginsianum]|nr:uncharacterized protein ColKHC_06906 [Colletotrichum higginsianum]
MEAWKKASLMVAPPEVTSLRTAKFLEGGVEALDKVVDDGAVGQDVVLGDADLAGVETLGPHEAAGGELDVGVFGDESRVQAAELKGDGGEVLGGLFGDDLADGGAAGVHYLVPLDVEQGLGLFDGAVDDGVGLGVEGSLEDLGQDHGGGRGALGGLQDGGAAGGDGADDGDEGQLDGEVEGADDEDHAEGLLANARLEHSVGEGHVLALLVGGELFEVLEHVEAVVGAPFDLGEKGLMLALA